MIFTYIAFVLIGSPLVIIVYFSIYKLILMIKEKKPETQRINKRINHPDLLDESVQIKSELNDEEIVAVISAAVKMYYQLPKTK